VEDRVRAICLALPEVTEKTSHGSPAFFAKKQFVMLWSSGHHDHAFPHIWCAAPPGAQEALVAAAPERFFRPPYVGGRGWIGLRLDGRVIGTRSKRSVKTPIAPSPPRSRSLSWKPADPTTFPAAPLTAQPADQGHRHGCGAVRSGI
jgi:hypothetical protein